MMSALTDTRPSAIVREFGYTVFYFDVQPKNMRKLPAYSEFNIVYSPSDVQGWETVRYRISHNRKGYCIVDRKPLQPNEIAYFENLMQDEAAPV